MEIIVGMSKAEMAQKAAERAGARIREAIAERRSARVIFATGASQFEFLDALVKMWGIDWTKVTGFHLDEYVGLPVTHKASFRAYMRERLVARTPKPMRAFIEVNGEAANPERECARLQRLIRKRPIDLACIGIGENGHLAFNDPPADFDADCAYKVVELDQTCRMQQVGEGWFNSIEEVPTHAYSMTIREIMSARAIVCTCPDERKAKAVAATVEGPITNMCPASILRRHPDSSLYIDRPAASLMDNGMRTDW